MENYRYGYGYGGGMLVVPWYGTYLHTIHCPKYIGTVSQPSYVQNDAMHGFI